MTPEFWLQVLIAAGAAVGIYAGIRGDLRAMHERLRSAEKDADRAHVRLDEHINQHLKGV